MPRSLIRTDNKRWKLTSKKFEGEKTSERGVLVYLIAESPEPVRTDVLVVAVQHLTGLKEAKRVPSRLVELEREGYIQSQFNADLFQGR